MAVGEIVEKLKEFKTSPAWGAIPISLWNVDLRRPLNSATKGSIRITRLHLATRYFVLSWRCPDTKADRRVEAQTQLVSSPQRH